MEAQVTEDTIEFMRNVVITDEEEIKRVLGRAIAPGRSVRILCLFCSSGFGHVVDVLKELDSEFPLEPLEIGQPRDITLRSGIHPFEMTHVTLTNKWTTQCLAPNLIVFGARPEDLAGGRCATTTELMLIRACQSTKTATKSLLPFLVIPDEHFH
jgi:hypothetical protein